LLFVKDDPEAAIPALQMAAQLNPRAPNRWATDNVLGIAYRVMRQFENAIRFGRLACQGGDQIYISHMNLAATLALAGQEDEAQGALVRAMELEPALSISFVGKNFGVGPKVTPSTIDGLRLAGLQE
jgi:tetratricopeptide (TPR) repeat protein